MATVLMLLALLSGTTGEAECATRLVIETYLQAYNQHDPEAVVATLHPDVAWYYLAGDELILELSGRDKLFEWLQGQFASVPGAHSTFSQWTVDGCLASVREVADGGAPPHQSALAVYQISDDLIRRVWYVLDSD